MAGFQNFRSAFRGFKRKDVVSYIEYMNNKHNSELEQLKNQLQETQAKAGSAELQEMLDAAQARIAELEGLEARVAELEAALAEKEESDRTSGAEQELEAYRRAERVEREASERAKAIYDQANAVLADATQKAESASAHIGAIADNVTAQLKEYQQSVQETKQNFQDAVATLHAICPEEE